MLPAINPTIRSDHRNLSLHSAVRNQQSNPSTM
jgi:hypothetical protein